MNHPPNIPPMMLPGARAPAPGPPSFTIRYPSDDSQTSGPSDGTEATLVDIYELYRAPRRPSYHVHRGTYASSMSAYHASYLASPPQPSRAQPHDAVLYDTQRDARDVASLRRHLCGAWQAIARLWCG